MNLDRDRRLVAVEPRAVVDEEQLLVVRVPFWTLPELLRVLDREFVQPQDLPECVDLLRVGVVEVEPEELLPGLKLLQNVGIDSGERVHDLRVPAVRPLNP